MNIADFVGIIGGIAGLGALSIEGVSIWRRRKPKLTLFAPYNFTGNNSENNARLLFVLIRISNSSERIANLFLETTRAEVLYRGVWYPVAVPSFQKNTEIRFDIPDEIQHIAGIKNFQFFNKFDEAVISFDRPYSRYIGMYSDSVDTINNAERVRLVIHDCNLRKYVIEGDIRKNDPEHMNP